MRGRKARGEPLDDEWNFVAVFTNLFRRMRRHASRKYLAVFISDIHLRQNNKIEYIYSFVIKISESKHSGLINPNRCQSLNHDVNCVNFNINI